MRTATTIVLETGEREQLQHLARGRRVEVRLAERAQIVLHATDGLMNIQIGEAMGIWRFSRSLA